MNQCVELRRPSATRPWQHVLEPLSGYLALAAELRQNESLNGEGYNFGPRSEQNRTVLELLRNLATIWGIEDSSKAFTALPDPPFHEAALLKLNCDKALLNLHWEPTLFYTECVEMTGMWYRDVLKGGRAAFDVTAFQISNYQAVARERGRIWAQDRQ